MSHVLVCINMAYLIIFSATCDADSVLVLLKGGANPNAVDVNGRTPLHCAVSKGIGLVFLRF